MTTPSHMSRTPPPRGGPNRNSAVPGSGGPQDLITAAGAAVCGVLENGVRTAYAVIDDYMRRGQEAARGIFNDATTRGSMSNQSSFSGYNTGGSYNPGGGNYNGGFNNPWGNNNPMAMLFEQWMSAMRAWSQAWPGFAQGGAWPQAGGFPFAAPAGQARGVAVKVTASRPVEVTVNLYPGVDAQQLLAADALHAEGFTAAPLAQPIVVRESGSVRVSLEVGAGQPSGRYRGLIRTKSGETVAGDLTVVVG